jgi:hypothetical protein
MSVPAVPLRSRNARERGQPSVPNVPTPYRVGTWERCLGDAAGRAGGRLDWGAAWRTLTHDNRHDAGTRRTGERVDSWASLMAGKLALRIVLLFLIC